MCRGKFYNKFRIYGKRDDRGCAKANAHKGPDLPETPRQFELLTSSESQGDLRPARYASHQKRYPPGDPRGGYRFRSYIRFRQTLQEAQSGWHQLPPFFAVSAFEVRSFNFNLGLQVQMSWHVTKSCKSHAWFWFSLVRFSLSLSAICSTLVRNISAGDGEVVPQQGRRSPLKPCYDFLYFSGYLSWIRTFLDLAKRSRWTGLRLKVLSALAGMVCQTSV